LSSSGIFHIQRSDSERSIIWRDFSKKTRTGQNLGKIIFSKKVHPLGMVPALPLLTNYALVLVQYLFLATLLYVIACALFSTALCLCSPSNVDIMHASNHYRDVGRGDSRFDGIHDAFSERCALVMICTAHGHWLLESNKMFTGFSFSLDWASVQGGEGAPLALLHCDRTVHPFSVLVRP
jgi:hypothetical protein